MIVRLHWMLMAIASLLLAGCSSDYSLSRVDFDPETPTEPGPSNPPDPPGPPGPLGPPGPPTPSNPHWPPQPGNVPDLYFAIAWSETPCDSPDDVSIDGDEPDWDGDEEQRGERDERPPESSQQFWVGCDARNVAVVNMFGEVVDEFAPPGLDPATMIEFKELVNAGPGRFLHVFDHYDGALFDTNDESDGFLAGGPWQAWRGDSYTGENILVAAWDWETGRILLPEAGRHINVGWSSNQLQMGILPTDPDWLVTWQGPAWCDPHTPIQPL